VKCRLCGFSPPELRVESLRQQDLFFLSVQSLFDAGLSIVIRQEKKVLDVLMAFRVTVIPGDDLYQCHAGNRRHDDKLKGVSRVDSGIRPQVFHPVPPTPGKITGRVFLREPLGLEDEVIVQASDGTRVKIVSASGEEFPEGREVSLDFEGKDLYLFNPESKKTLCFGINSSSPLNSTP
jgi:hypothetical protein